MSGDRLVEFAMHTTSSVASLLSGRYVAIVATGYCAGRLECDLEAIVGS